MNMLFVPETPVAEARTPVKLCFPSLINKERKEETGEKGSAAPLPQKERNPDFKTLRLIFL